MQPIDPALVRKYRKMLSHAEYDTPEGHTARKMCKQWEAKHPGLAEAAEEAAAAERLQDLLRRAGGHADAPDDPTQPHGGPARHGAPGGGWSDLLRRVLFGAGDALGLEDARKYADMLQWIMDHRDFVEDAFGWGEVIPDDDVLDALERRLVFDRVGRKTVKVPVKGKRKKDAKGKRRGKALRKHRKENVVVVHFTIPEEVWIDYLEDGDAEAAVALLQIIEDAVDAEDADAHHEEPADYRDLDPGD